MRPTTTKPGSPSGTNVNRLEDLCPLLDAKRSSCSQLHSGHRHSRSQRHVRLQASYCRGPLADYSLRVCLSTTYTTTHLGVLTAQLQGTASNDCMLE